MRSSLGVIRVRRFGGWAVCALTVLLAGCGSAAPPAPVTRVLFAPANRIQASTRVGTAPIAVAVGAGAVWVVNSADSTVTRVDPATHAAGRPIPVGRGALAIAAGPEGVWVASAAGAVVRIDPATQRVTGTPIAVVDPAGIATGDGGVWVSSRQTDSVIHIDPASARPVGGPIRVGSQPTDIATAPRGVWVANSADGTVTRIDPATGKADPALRVAKVPAPTPGAGGRPHEQPGAAVLALTAGDGGVWVAKTDSLETARIEVLRVDPATHRLSGRPIEVTGGIPLRLAAGSGAVWVTDAGSILPGPGARAPALLRIDPRAGARAGPPLPLGSEPTGLAAGPDDVWVSTVGDNTVREVNAPR